MKSSEVICLGEALVDRLGPLGGDPTLEIGSKDCLGGAPANVACALARLDIDVAFVGCLGDDSIGQQFFNLFNSRGVNISGLQVHPTLPTRVVLVHRDSHGERSFRGFAGEKVNIFADQALDLDKLKMAWPSVAKDAKWLLLGTILLAQEGSRKVVAWALDQAKLDGMNIAMDLNWRPTFWDVHSRPDSPPSNETRFLVKSFLAKVSLLKLAKEEAILFFNSQDPREISESLPLHPSVIITDGAESIRWLLGDYRGETQSFSPPSVIDTTGAGDSFMAGVISQIAVHSVNPKSYIEADSMIRFAAGCGALVCAGMGAIDPQPSNRSVQDFLSSLS
ncbi:MULTISPECIES: carbohydrate kinase family protein [unclassified Prochlorococcus]|uniref:carbohydrate kinase family protein n=1 Tax=unclassified Prochlorococcus TaxID=2627481 RepID=UPI000533B65C|nr:MULTISPECIES: carbohydrate kinase [unclassified Prochlorococcus]KGG14598.1 Fructokinase [Prochlorococcus sp. MIT 0602]KGG15975.1 Fructokinase [Prochlorococcus sp. MIT 0603]